VHIHLRGGGLEVDLTQAGVALKIGKGDIFYILYIITKNILLTMFFLQVTLLEQV